VKLLEAMAIFFERWLFTNLQTYGLLMQNVNGYLQPLLQI